MSLVFKTMYMAVLGLKLPSNIIIPNHTKVSCSSQTTRRSDGRSKLRLIPSFGGGRGRQYAAHALLTLERTLDQRPEIDLFRKRLSKIMTDILPSPGHGESVNNSGGLFRSRSLEIGRAHV